MSTDALLDEFGLSHGIQQRVVDACVAASVPGACLALVGEQRALVCVHGSAAGGGAFDAAASLPFACAAKLFVATFLVALEQAGTLGLDDEIARHLVLAPDARDFLQGITLRHLLSQTDGIGYRPLLITPARESGFIDVDALLTMIRSDRRLFVSGQSYSTSRCGFGLLGAVIERYLERPFGAVLRDDLLCFLRDLSRATPGGSHGHAATVCPGSGSGLELSTSELVAFLQFQLAPRAFDIARFRPVTNFAALFERQLESHGWSGGATGTCLAWRTFSSGWLGQNGNSDQGTVVVRLHPARKLALVFQCRAPLPIAYAVLGRVLGATMAEFNPPDAPRLLSTDERNALDTERYVGKYGNKFRRIEIRATPSRQLEVEISKPGHNGYEILGRGVLLPATHEIFFIPPPNTYGIWFVQRLRGGAGDPAAMLWDGWNLWPRLAAL